MLGLAAGELNLTPTGFAELNVNPNTVLSARIAMSWNITLCGEKRAGVVEFVGDCGEGDVAAFDGCFRRLLIASEPSKQRAIRNETSDESFGFALTNFSYQFSSIQSQQGRACDAQDSVISMRRESR